MEMKAVFEADKLFHELNLEKGKTIYEDETTMYEFIELFGDIYILRRIGRGAYSHLYDYVAPEVGLFNKNLNNLKEEIARHWEKEKRLNKLYHNKKANENGWKKVMEHAVDMTFHEDYILVQGFGNNNTLKFPIFANNISEDSKWFKENPYMYKNRLIKTRKRKIRKN